MYIVMEIQTNVDNTIGILTWSFANQNLAEEQFHRVLTTAATSNLPKHAACLVSEEGFPLRHECYTHVPVPTSEE